MLTLRAFLITLVFSGIATSAQASVILTALEGSGIADCGALGDCVIISGGGTLNRDDWTGLANEASLPTLQADAIVSVGPATGPLDVDSRSGEPVSFTGPTSIGPGTLPFTATMGSGDIFGLDWDDPTLIVPNAYVSLNPLEGTSIWEDETFDSLGLAFGSYTWSWGSGEGESFTLNVVPEPSVAALMTLGLVGLAARRRRA